MSWRKWLVRGLVFSALGGTGLVALLFQAWTNPSAIRRLVADKLGDKFVGAVVGVESAQLRLLGGIAISELRMSRRDDLDRNDFLYAPAAVIYHDKEQMTQGHLAIRKVELNRPQLRIVRQRDGTVNLDGILGPMNLNERMPMTVMHRATLFFEDRASDAPGPVLEIKQVNLTVINDPLPIVTIEGGGLTDIAGPVQIVARLHRGSGEAAISIEASAIPIGPVSMQRLALVAPRAAAQVRNLTGMAKVKATVIKRGNDSPEPLSYDVRAELHHGALTHARLPMPLEQMDVTTHVRDGRIVAAHLTARSGVATTLEVTLRDAVVPSAEGADFENSIGELDGKVEHLPVTANLFACLPLEMQDIQRDYKPLGTVTVKHTFRRESSGGWRKHWVFQPEGMGGEYLKFPYPVEKVTGTIERELTSDHRGQMSFNLEGTAGGRPVRLMGRLEGEKARERIEIDVWGDDIPIDETLLKALPAKNRAQVALYNLRGKADVKAQIRREAGHREYANRFFIRFHDAAVKYNLFPYPVEKVTGVLDVLPDHWECRDFRGTHNGGEMRVSARSEPLPPEPGSHGEQEKRQRVTVAIQGTDILLDEEFAAALAPPEAPNRAPLQKAWHTLAMSGRLSFAAEVVDLPNQPQNIDVGVTIRGCAMKPRFFPYALQEVSGTVRYARDRVWMTGVKARHATSVLGLREGQVLLKAGGGFQARLAGISGNPVVPDVEFLKALPPLLRKGLEPFKIHDPVAVATELVVDVSPDPATPPQVWWDGSATFHNASLRTGVEVTGIEGQIASCGRHNGRNLEGVSGNILLRKATVLNQPIENLHGRIEVSPESPDVVRIRDLHGDWFGGTIGGEARIELAPLFRYDLVLKAVQVQLEEFARHNLGPNADVQGAAVAALHLNGEGASIGGLKGHGRVDIPNGKLYRLPVLLDLLKTLGLRVPDRTAFEQATAIFKFDGPQLQVQQLDLIGNVVSLRGLGNLNLDGSDLNLDFHADWARVMQVLPAGLNTLPRAVSDRLFKIKMRGRVGEVRLEKEFVPAVAEPIKRAFGKD